jgi:ubiquinone/menaquinone biosynthesis C-methylase UbiE
MHSSEKIPSVEHYLHGYSPWEQARLVEQARVLAPYIFRRLDFGGIRHLLEVGCGVGGQSLLLLEQYPGLSITGIEVEPEQLRRAELNRSARPDLAPRWNLLRADALELGAFDGSPFDAALFVWVLEHLPDPLLALRELVRVLAPGARVMATEVFQDSLYLYPECPALRVFWKKTIAFQQQLRGDANIGPRLGGLFREAGLAEVSTWTCPMHLDGERPGQLHRMLDYWRDLVRSALPNMAAAGIADEREWQAADEELAALKSREDAVFYYSSFQAVGTVPQMSPCSPE